mgnify:FL=1
MGFFCREKTLYRSIGTRPEWEAAKVLLSQAGIEFSACSMPSEAPICGCGAKLDIRDFGPNGKVDREAYYIDVPETLWEAGRRILRSANIVTVEPGDDLVK